MTHGNYESSTRDLSLRTRNRFPSQSNESTGNSVTTTIMNHTQPPKAGERISKKGPRPRETKEASVQRNVETNGLASPEYQTSPCAKPERSSFTFRQRTPPNTARSVETGASPSKKNHRGPTCQQTLAFPTPRHQGRWIHGNTHRTTPASRATLEEAKRLHEPPILDQRE